MWVWYIIVETIDKTLRLCLVLESNKKKKIHKEKYFIMFGYNIKNTKKI